MDSGNWSVTQASCSWGESIRRRRIPVDAVQNPGRHFVLARKEKKCKKNTQSSRFGTCRPPDLDRGAGDLLRRSGPGLAAPRRQTTDGLIDMSQGFPEVQGGGSLIVAWQVRNKNVLVVGGGEVRLASRWHSQKYIEPDAPRYVIATSQKARTDDKTCRSPQAVFSMPSMPMPK